MEFKILGPLEVFEDGRQIEIRAAKQRALLAILLLHANHVVSTDHLIEALWDDEVPETAQKALQVYISRLRKALGKERLETKASGYRLRVEQGELDLERFQSLAEDDPREALALWRGDALAEFAYLRFAQTETARLEELRLSSLVRRLDEDLERGRHAVVAGELERLVREHPLHERLRAQFMLALYRSGRQADALETFAEARRALTGELGLDPGDELRALQKAILEHDPSLAAPQRIAPTPGPRSARDFVGRSAELSSLRGALDDALGGSGQLVLISGEPGIGKSRLADELVAHANARGATILVGRCWEAGGAPAFWPWVQALRTYIQQSEADVLREQLGASAPDLAQLFPELRELYPDLPPPPSVESDGARFRLFDATSAFIKKAARARPLVIVLDDLHAADDPSLLLLRFLALQLAESRLLVLALFRDVDPTLREPLAPTVVDLLREPVTRRVPLAGLAASDVFEFVQRAYDGHPSDDLVTAIYEETAGNPLFVGEVVRLLATEGRLGESRARVSIPEGVREAIARRVGRLGAGVADLLRLASVFGREFELESLAAVSGQTVDAVVGLLDVAMAERIIDEVPNAPGSLRFAHVLMRDTLYDDLTPAHRMRLHRSAGEALEWIHAEDIDHHLAAIGLHFIASAPLGTRERAISYTRRAAERAASLLAHEEAVRLYEMALTLVGDDRSRCELLLALGEVQARAGDTPASKETLLKAAALAEELGSAERLAQAALRYGGRLLWEVSRDDKQHVALLERALEGLGDADSALRVRLLARLAGGPLRAADYPRERRAALSQEAVAMARRIGDPGLLANALHGHTQAALLAPDRADERRELIDELLEAATAADDKEAAIEGHEESVLTHLSLGDRHGADLHFAAMEKLADELRQPAQYWLVAVHHALRALLEGRLSEAEGLVSEARRIGERTQSWNVAVSYGLQLFALRREQGRLDEVESEIRASAERYASYVTWRSVVTSMVHELGHEAEARAELELLAHDEFAPIPFDEQWLVSLTLLAEVSTALDDLERSAVLYRHLLPFEDRVAVSYPEFSTGSVARSLGLLADTMERWDDAARHFEVALEMNERMSARPWLARTQRDYAELLLRRDASGDRERAVELEHAARTLADTIGMRLAAQAPTARR